LLFHDTAFFQPLGRMLPNIVPVLQDELTNQASCLTSIDVLILKPVLLPYWAPGSTCWREAPRPHHDRPPRPSATASEGPAKENEHVAILFGSSAALPAIFVDLLALVDRALRMGADHH
jgi:hypothetical protein